MLEELQVLGIVSERLDAARLSFMLTGSFAMAVQSHALCHEHQGRPDRAQELRVSPGELARRQPVNMHGVRTWIVSREDLILSKLVWAKDSGSELQRRDVRTLLDESMDRAYLEHWSARLGVAEALAEALR